MTQCEFPTSHRADSKGVTPFHSMNKTLEGAGFGSPGREALHATFTDFLPVNTDATSVDQANLRPYSQFGNAM
jgi:hypothetical protein